MSNINLRKMRKKVISDINNYLGIDDDINNLYEIKYNGEDVYLILSYKKIVFASEQGLLRKITKIIGDIPYTSVRNVRSDGDYKIIVSTYSNKIYNFITVDTPSYNIENIITEMKKFNKSSNKSIKLQQEITQ
jgi:hypothetical protein